MSDNRKAKKRVEDSYKELMVIHEDLLFKKQLLKNQIELEENLKMEKAFSENVINNVNAIIIVWDVKGRIKTVNSFAQTLLEYNENELKNKLWMEELIIKEARKELYTIFNRAISGEIIKNYESQVVSKKGKVIDALWNTSVVRDSTGNILEIISVGTNITTFKAMERNIYDLACYDSLTNLYNRNKIKKEVEKLIKEKDSFKFALLYIGIDNFKYINDSLGHSNGDKLLIDLSQLLKEIFSSSKIIARANGDEFIVVLEYEEDENYIIRKINEFLNKVKMPWKIKDKELQITVSVGISLYPYNGDEFTTLFEKAYTSMLYRKKIGKNGYAFYSYEIDENNLNYINTVNELRRGIKHKEFTLLYQPQVDLIKGGIIGVEALIRWKHPKKGIVPPNDFIPLAEEIGYIQDISKWVIKTACKQKKQWQEKGFDNLKVSINVSNNCLKEEGFLKEFEEILKQCDVDKNGIVVEITETSIMHNLEEGMKILSKLRESGIKIALDDFGTGYSSLNYLRKLPIDILKIDRDFIKDIKYELQNEVILKHLIEVGHALGLEIVAEGIESLQQLSLLNTYGCDIGQGYLFSKPLEVQKLEELLERF
ncbi:sensor protein [Clostridium tetani 12124569]|nr:sensor protein [Clostridium tetani 12124569]